MLAPVMASKASNLDAIHILDLDLIDLEMRQTMRVCEQAFICCRGCMQEVILKPCGYFPPICKRSCLVPMWWWSETLNAFRFSRPFFMCERGGARQLSSTYVLTLIPESKLGQPARVSN